ncbi:MAG TPA: hypothetical protein DHV89_02950 [Ruminococcus sp.]|nr:hypothetical protein [Ruminococcus sp.]
MKTRLNNEVSIEYPESFMLMSAEELERYFSSSLRRSGAKEPKKNFIVSVSWTKRTEFPASLFVNEKSCLNSCAARCRRTLEDFMQDGDISKDHHAGRVSGFEYSYTSGGKPCHGAAAAIKLNGRIYLAEYRTDSFDRMYCNMAFNMVLSSIKAL